MLSPFHPVLTIVLCLLFALMVADAAQSSFSDGLKNLTAATLGIVALVALVVWWPGWAIL
jgi:hypothetical protein